MTGKKRFKKYGYHGTCDVHLESIRERGLDQGTFFSEFEDAGFFYASTHPLVHKGEANFVVLRFPFPASPRVNEHQYEFDPDYRPGEWRLREAIPVDKLELWNDIKRRYVKL